MLYSRSPKQKNSAAPLLSTRAALLAALALAVVLAWSAPSASTAPRAGSKPAPDCGAKEFGALPLRFEPNVGQTEARVKFLARLGRYDLYLTPGEAVFALSGPRAAALRMKLAGARSDAAARGLEPLAGASNYLTGRDASRWRTAVPHFGRVEFASVYRGIDLVYYGNGGRVEYDFRVAPGADPSVIRMDFEGARRPRVDARGDLLLRTAAGEMRLSKPFAYQETPDGSREEVAARFEVRGRRVRFRLGSYDSSRPLVIDPCVIYGSFLGGAGDDRGLGVGADAQGHAYVAGLTTSLNFPAPGSAQPGIRGASDAFVAKLSPDGSSLVWVTYFGGSGVEDARGLAVDAAGNAYITGITDSFDLPTLNAFQPSKGSTNGFIDAYVAKLSPSGSLVYSTYLGGWRPDQGEAIAADAAGSAYVTGSTGSNNINNANFRTFPVTPGAYQQNFPSLNAGGGNSAAFVTKLGPTGALAYSTFLGGLGNPAGSTAGDVNPDDLGYGIAVDSAGQAHVSGRTESERFPVTPGAVQGLYGGGLSDAFFAKLDAAGTSLAYSTFLGGSGEENRTVGAVAVDAADNAYLAGGTNSTNFPTHNALQPNYGGNPETEAYVAKLTPSGSFVYSTYFGSNNFKRAVGVAADAAGTAYVTGTNTLRRLAADGSATVPTWSPGGEGRDVALDPQGNIYLSGMTTTTDATKCTNNTQFCPTRGAFQQNAGGGAGDAFVMKFKGDGQPIQIAGYTFAPEAAVDDVTLVSQPLASGQLCSAVNYAGTTTHQRVRNALSDGCPATSTQGDAEFETHFTDNRVVNLPGPDLVVFEVGSGAGNEPFSLSVFDPSQGGFTAAQTIQTTPTAFFDCSGLRINVAEVDLSAFGVAAGATVSRLKFDNLFVPNVVAAGAEISDVLALNSAPPNDAPNADAGPDRTLEATGAQTSAALDGSGSADPDGDALAYEWKDGQGNVVGTTAEVSLSLPLGTHDFTLTVRDPSGASASDGVTVVVRDTTAPSVECGAADGQWHASDVSINCTASDAASGLLNASDASFALVTNVPANTEDANAATNGRQVCDAAGNCATAGPVAGNKVDKKAPDIQIASPAQGASYAVGQQAAADYDCADAGSGVAACAGTVASGSLIDTSSPGTKTFNVTATDAAGNASSRSVTYTVGYGVCVLYDQTKAHRAGSTIPVKLQLCDASGANISAPGLVVTALGTVRLSDFAPGEVEDAGHANPDDNFRFTAFGDAGGYIFNLKTTGLTTGTYVLVFRAGSDPSTHGVQFQIK